MALRHGVNVARQTLGLRSWATPETYDPPVSTNSDKPPRSTPHSRTGKRIALALVIVWVAIIVGLYAVLAKLKMGGAEALRRDAQDRGHLHSPSSK